MKRMLRLRCICAADAQFLSTNAGLLQIAEDLFGHAFGQIDKAVVFANIYAADELAFEASFVRDGANDVAGFDAMNVADFNAIGFALNVVSVVVASARCRFL
jgi:hypothetical protein